MFSDKLAENIVEALASDDDERALIKPFIEVCRFLSEYPSEVSWRTSKETPSKPSVSNEDGLRQLAQKYYESYRRSDFPAEPSTVPDEIVSIIMREAYGYKVDKCEHIKIEHQHSMCAENCVGNLLERYIDSVLRGSGWNWCCGEFVKAIDFLGKNERGEWVALQIKNRDNSENSSSAAIRDGTHIQKWFRSFSKDTKKGRPSFTNWDKLPSLMQGYNLNEEDFKKFVIQYIRDHHPNKK